MRQPRSLENGHGAREATSIQDEKVTSFSYEYWPLPELLMGADAPTSPITIGAAAPAGAFAAASIPRFPGNRTCPAVP
jgi:hypothetical protein